jgi:hypothetical protein
MYMGIYFAWATMTLMSSRVYLNLVLAAHGGGSDDVTTGGLSSFHAGQANHPESTERETGQTVTLGANRVHRRVPVTTFTTVGLYLFSFTCLPCISPIIAYRHSLLSISLQTVSSVEYNTQQDAESDSPA